MEVKLGPERQARPEHGRVNLVIDHIRSCHFAVRNRFISRVAVYSITRRSPDLTVTLILSRYSSKV